MRCMQKNHSFVISVTIFGFECLLQATSALDEKSKLEKALRELQIVQEDKKVKLCPRSISVLFFYAFPQKEFVEWTDSKIKWIFFYL